MENNANKEIWINGVLESTSGMQRAMPRTGLYDRVMSGLNGQAKGIPMPSKHWIAAAILLLIFNVGSIVYVMSQNKKTPSTAISATLFTEIQSTATYNY